VIGASRSACCIGLGLSAPALAQDAASPVNAGSLLQVFAGLVLVLLLVLGTAWMVRRMGSVPGLSNQAIKMVGAASVGSRERVVLLEVAGTWIVVGVAPGQVRSLATLPKADIPVTPPSPTAAPAFAQWLQRFTDKTHAG
jgi:flagellar protein FliO/FliZ